MSEQQLRVAQLLPWFRGDWSRISIGRYAASIADSLDGEIEFSRIFGTHYNLPTWFRRRIPGEGPYSALPRHWSGEADLIHCIDTWQTIHRKRFRLPFVATIHDAIPKDMIKLRGPRSAARLHTFWRGYRAAAQATHVITPSEFTRQELLSFVNIEPERVTAIPVIVPHHFQPEANFQENAIADGETILSVGTAESYKNLPLLLHALAQPDLKGVRLVRVGSWLDSNQRKLAEALGIADRITELGSVPEDVLLEQYWRCSALAQPSLTEGFGMPAAEAMACGLPVVASNGGSLPEVVGDAGVVVPLSTFEPNVVVSDDARRFALALAEVISDGAKRAEMRALGFERVKAFRPEAIAPKIREVYRTAAGR